MASADMAEAVEHALVGQDMIGGDQVGDSRRIDRSSGFGGLRRRVHAGRNAAGQGGGNYKKFPSHANAPWTRRSVRWMVFHAGCKIGRRNRMLTRRWTSLWLPSQPFKRLCPTYEPGQCGGGGLGAQR